MKHHILFVLVLVFCLPVLAQENIQRTFFGCSLGITTEAQTRLAMGQKGYVCEKTIGLKTTYLNVKNIIWAGETWPSVTFEFYNDQLIHVKFLASVFDDIEPPLITYRYAVINRMLTEKYPSLAIDPFVLDGDNDSFKEYFLEKHNKKAAWADTKTTIKMVEYAISGMEFVCISYYDTALKDASEYKASDDL